MSGGGGSQPSTTTTVQKNEPPAYLAPYLTDIAARAQTNYYGSKPTYFPGQTYAGPSGATTNAINQTIQRATTGNPLLPAAQGQSLAMIRGDYLDPAKNQYLRASVDAANRPLIDNYMQSVAPGNDARFSLAGRYGSGAHVNAQTQAQDALQRGISENAANMYANAYGQERGYQNAAIAGAPALAEADYGDIGKLAAAGQTQEGYSQQAIDAAIARHNFEQNREAAKLAQYSNLVTAQNQGGTSTATQTTPMTGNNFLSTLGQGVGTAAQLAMLGRFLFSDRRVKTDVEKVGKTDAGTNVYTYRYKGDPSGAVHMGVMAQEIARKRPDAVRRHPLLGTLMVDYSRVA